jgi:hypothetical protein
MLMFETTELRERFVETLKLWPHTQTVIRKLETIPDTILLALIRQNVEEDRRILLETQTKLEEARLAGAELQAIAEALAEENKKLKSEAVDSALEHLASDALA